MEKLSLQCVYPMDPTFASEVKRNWELTCGVAGAEEQNFSFEFVSRGSAAFPWVWISGNKFFKLHVNYRICGFRSIRHLQEILQL